MHRLHGPFHMHVGHVMPSSTVTGRHTQIPKGPAHSVMMGQTSSMTRIIGAGRRRCLEIMNRQHNTQMPMYVSAIRSSQYMLDSMRILQIVSPLSMMLSKKKGERFPLSPEEPVLAHRFPLLYGLTPHAGAPHLLS